MELTFIIIISLIAYLFGSITKAFIDEIPNKFIPLQNVFIGLISGIVCFFLKIETNLLVSITFCLISCMNAGGFSDLINIKKNGVKNEISTKDF